MNEAGEYGRAIRVTHEREQMRAFLKALPAGSKIALETSGSYYWLVEEMERAGHQAQLAHAQTAKRRMEGRHKTDERIGEVIAQWDSAAGMDSTGQVARPARNAALADEPGG